MGMASLGGVGVTKGSLLLAKGYPFLAREKGDIDIMANYGHSGAQKVPKCSKIALKIILLGSF
jgi:hypothetical protein